MEAQREPGVDSATEWEPPWRRPRVRAAWSGRDFLLAGIGVGVALGVAAAGLVAWYVVPLWHPNPARAQVAVSPEDVLTGPGASVWRVSLCPPGNYSQGTSWSCTVSLKDIESGTAPPTRTVDQIQVAPLTLLTVYPGVPQSVQSGGSLHFELDIGLNYTVTSSSVSLTIVIDSR